jgi:tRNA dimethylallyltransferase
MIEEVKSLQLSGLKWERLESFGLEYKYIAQYLQDKIDYKEMFLKLNTSIHQFAKRQETWFRRMERKGVDFNWIEGGNYNLLKETVLKYL